MNLNQDNPWMKTVFCAILLIALLTLPRPVCAAEAEAPDGKAMTKVEAFERGDFVDAEPFDLIGGGEFDISEYRNRKVVVIAFWLPNCELCFQQLRELDAFINENNRKKDVEVLTVTKAGTRAEKELAEFFIKKENIDFPVAMDKNMVIARTFGASQIPIYIAIDKNGRLATPEVSYPSDKIRNLSFYDYVDYLIEERDIPETEFFPFTCSDEMKKKIGTDAPSFALESIRGETYSLEEYRDRMNVLVIFWHPYSRTSSREMKKLIKYYTEYRREHNFVLLSVVSIYGQSQKDAVAQFVAQNKAPYPVLDDQESRVGKLFDVEHIPTALFINKKGIIVEVIERETRPVEKRFNAIFNSLLKD